MTPQQDKLIIDHRNYALSIARGMRRRIHLCVQTEELEAEAQFGLVLAAADFNPGRGVLFKTWAWPFVRGAIDDYLRRLTWVMDFRTKEKLEAAGKVPPSLTRVDSQRAMQWTDSTDAARAMLANLSPRERDAVWLRYVEGLELLEVAMSLGIHFTRVSQLCSRGIEKLMDDSKRG